MILIRVMHKKQEAVVARERANARQLRPVVPVVTQPASVLASPVDDIDVPSVL